ncbi:MAG: secretin N-terminal domain-containing protein [Acidobacteriota bacterium]|nr:secretin N-terminal domain-containing protein [Acidobacteriota bacterium]
MVNGVVLVALAAVLAAGCATGRSFARGETAGQAGDWEAAVGFYRQALEDDPDRPDYKIALERAMLMASTQYTDRARQFEAAGQLEEALRAYTKAMEFEPSNRTIAAKAAEIERLLRDRIEAATPPPAIDQLRQQARRSIEPVLSPTNPEPLIVNLVNTSLREILSFIGNYSGINVTFDRDFQDRSITLKLEGVSLEQALQQIMIANQLFYKVLNERTIIVAADSTQKRTQYEDQVIRTFFISNADATEMQALLTGMLRVAGMAIQPQIVPNKTANTLTIRATAAVVAVAERIIEANDKPRAEVSVNVQILEVSRERAKRYGLDLGSYSAALNFSPESTPSDKPFNLNTISQGVSTADFYLQVPSAVVRFLESDSQTKVLAKPNLRGTEGQKLSLNLGEDVPVPSTTFTPIAAGGSTVNPLTSYGYRTIGIIVDMTPRVTYDGDIILEISIENSARGTDTNIAGQNLPSFFSRKVQTRLRLRDGESNLLAGLLREDERKSLTGFPGIMRLPIVKQLFSSNDNLIKQTDIVMLLTPRILRTHELKASDLSPIYIGTQSNMVLGGPPAVIGGDAPAAAVPGTPAIAVPPTTPGVAPSPAAAAAAGMQPAAAPVLPGGGPRPVVPPGSSPIPGMTMPAAVAAAPSPAAAPPPDEPAVAPEPAPIAPPPAPAAPAAATAAAPASPPAVVPARISVSPPSEMRIGSGPYTVPISISGATRVSTLTISVTYNPALVRVRSVQEGTFMRQGGVTPAFTSQIDEKSGRVDLVITRPGDQTGASSAGLLGALLIEPVAAGTGSLSVTGSASVPGGASVQLQFLPAGVTVR